MNSQVTSSEPTVSDYKKLFKLGGIAAWAAALLTLSETIGFIFYPQPDNVKDWFILFQSNRTIGIMDFWGLEIPMYAMFILVFLSLYFLLGKSNKVTMTIALILALLGIGVFFATNNPVTMLSLSNQYAAATTDAQRLPILAAGQALLTNTNQRAVGGFNIALFLVSIAGMITSIVLLQSNTFSKTVAYTGILAHGLSLADYLRQTLTSSIPISLMVIIPNALFIVIWFSLVGWWLFRMGLPEEKQIHEKFV